MNKSMLLAGFRQSEHNPRVYWHPVRHLKSLVHGDDFVTSGHRQNVQWFRLQLEGRFEIKTSVVGGGADYKREESILGRTVRYTEDGWQLEADQRHGELFIKEMGLQQGRG